MSVADWCILAAVLLYLLTLAPAKASGLREFDNRSPRDPTFYEHPFRARALAAHMNGIETFPFFAAAILLAQIKGGHQSVIDGLAVAFLLLRVSFVLAYLGNRPTLRSVLWGLAFGCNVLIFVSPALWRA